MHEIQKVILRYVCVFASRLEYSTLRRPSLPGNHPVYHYQGSPIAWCLLAIMVFSGNLCSHGSHLECVFLHERDSASTAELYPAAIHRYPLCCCAAVSPHSQPGCPCLQGATTVQPQPGTGHLTAIGPCTTRGNVGPNNTDRELQPP